MTSKENPSSRYRPSYAEYNQRFSAYNDVIGVESALENKDYGSALRQWNVESSIGFSEAELDILSLIYSVDEQNKRLENDPFAHPAHGGNTAEHPIFMGLAFDHFRDTVGLDGARDKDIAALSRHVHKLIAVHDVGEVIDVSFSEQKASGATFKEPPEEELVGPFKLKLAAYALSTNQPELYIDTVTGMKSAAIEAKQRLFEDAVAGKITGDEFILGFGKVIGQKVAEAEAAMQHHGESDKTYADAANNLIAHFKEGEAKNTTAGYLMALVDRYEGTAHYSDFLGKAAKQFAAANPTDNPEERMFNRLFGAGDNLSYTLADAKSIVAELKFSHKPILAAFDAATKETDPKMAQTATKLVGSISAGILRARIKLLQHSAPLLDFSGEADKDAAVTPTANRDEQESQLSARLRVQRQARDTALPAMRQRRGHVESIEPVMDTKSVIAVLEKAANAMENGTWTPQPTKSGLTFEIGEKLPEALRVTPQELKASNQRYPLDVAAEFRQDRLKGQSIRI